MNRKLIVISVTLGLVGSVWSQATEVHQLAAVSQFTGIYSYIGSYIAVRELYFLAGLITILVAGNILITFMQMPSMFLPVHHNQKRSLSKADPHLSAEFILAILSRAEVNREMVSGVIDGHPVISLPLPHGDDHPGLAQFTGASIVPMLRFYSLSFRIFITMALAFLLILRPYWKFISIHGKDSPAAFQAKLGKVKWDYRSLQEYQEFNPLRSLEFVLKSVESVF